MRFWLILLQVTGFCLVITVIFFLYTASGASAGDVADGVYVVAAIDALFIALTGVSQLAAFAATVSAIAQPFLVVFVISFGCAFLTGYKRLQWLRWVGFIVSLGAGICWLVIFEAALFALPIWGFYFLCAALFLLMARKQDAEKIRRPVALLHPVLWAAGLACWFFAAKSLSPLTFAVTACFYAIPFFLHFKITRSIALRAKPLIKLVAILALSLIGVFAFLFARPVLVGPLLLSWLTLLFFAETLFVSSRMPDVAHDSLGKRSRRALKIVALMAATVGAIYGGAVLYYARVEATLPSVTVLKSTEGIRNLLKLSDEQAAKVVLIPLSELPPHIASDVEPYLGHYMARVSSYLQKRLLASVGNTETSGLAWDKLRNDLYSELTEDEMMSAFLAMADYGNGAYGISAAAEKYYNKTLPQLNICEAAMLAGMSIYPDKNPIDDPDGAKGELHTVLWRMWLGGKVSDEEQEMCMRER